MCLCIIINYCGWLGVKCVISDAKRVLYDLKTSFLAVISLSMWITYNAASSYCFVCLFVYTVLFVCLYCFVRLFVYTVLFVCLYCFVRLFVYTVLFVCLFILFCSFVCLYCFVVCLFILFCCLFVLFCCLFVAVVVVLGG